MRKNLHVKLVLILVLLIVSLMVVVGSVWLLPVMYFTHS